MENTHVQILKEHFNLRQQAGVSGNNGGPLFGGGGWVLTPNQYIKARPLL